MFFKVITSDVSPNASSYRIWKFFFVELKFVELIWALIGVSFFVNIFFATPHLFRAHREHAKSATMGFWQLQTTWNSILVAKLIFHHATLPTFLDTLTTTIGRPCLEYYSPCVFFLFFAFWKVHGSDFQYRVHRVSLFRIKYFSYDDIY